MMLSYMLVTFLITRTSMGQIFNRFTRIAKSFIDDSTSSANQLYNDKDAELRKIIDELNGEYSKKHHERKTAGARPRQSQQAPPPNHQVNQMNLSGACELLKVNTNASIEEIKHAYKKRVMEYHPDRVASLGEELQILARNKTQEINQAYDFLKKQNNM